MAYSLKKLFHWGLVLLKDRTLLERTWPLGIVTAIHPGVDGNVRVVDVWVRGKV